MAISMNVFHLLFLTGAIFSQASGYCTVGEFSHCLGKLKKFVAEHGLNADSSFVKFDSEHDLDVLCSDFEYAEHCMSNVIPFCDTSIRAMWEAEQEGYHYLCYDKKEELLLHNQCVLEHQDGLRVKTQECAEVYKQRIDLEPAEYCIETKRLISCATDHVKDTCGKDAASLQEKYYLLTLSPVSKQVEECILADYYKASTVRVVVACLVCLTAFVSILVAFSWVIKQLKPLSQAPRMTSMTNVASDPDAIIPRTVLYTELKRSEVHGVVKPVQ